MPTPPEAPTKPVPPTISAPAPLNQKTNSQPAAGTTVQSGKETSQPAASSEKPAVSSKTLQKTAAPDSGSTTEAPAPAQAAPAAALSSATSGETTTAQTSVPPKTKQADSLFPSAVSSWLLAAVLLIGLAMLGLRLLKRKPHQPARTVIDYSTRSKIVAKESGIDINIAPPPTNKPEVKSHFEVRI